MDHPFSTILLPMQIIFAGVRRKDLFPGTDGSDATAGSLATERVAVWFLLLEPSRVCRYRT